MKVYLNEPRPAMSHDWPLIASGTGEKGCLLCHAPPTIDNLNGDGGVCVHACACARAKLSMRVCCVLCVCACVRV